MYGFNVTDSTFPYDNRPVAPLQDYTFAQWWFHGHLDYPPNAGDVFPLPAGKPAVAELGCNKGVTSYWASSEGRTDVSQGDNPCPSDDGSFPSGAMHTTGLSDVKGCALAIAYESDVSKIQPADFAVFSVNHTCVWTKDTTFDIPARMPPCPEGGCHCAWFWIHAADAGSEQSEYQPPLSCCLLVDSYADGVMLDYMNGFRCNITSATSNVPIAKAQVPRRCGADPANGKPDAAPGNCTYGAKQPFYWFQREDNNVSFSTPLCASAITDALIAQMFEGTFSPPEYTDLYNFLDGAQNDIFADSYPNGLPVPGPSQTSIPTPILNPTSTSGSSITSTAASSRSSSAASSSSSATPSSTVATSASSSVIPSSSSASPSSSSASSSSSSASPSATSSPSSATSVSLTATSSAAASSSSSVASSTSSTPHGHPSGFGWGHGRGGDRGRGRPTRGQGNGNGRGGFGRNGGWNPRMVRSPRKEQKRSGFTDVPLRANPPANHLVLFVPAGRP